MRNELNSEKVSKSFIELNPHIFGEKGIAPIQPTQTLDLSKMPPTKADAKAEKELQRLCQNGLNQRGYVSLTGDNAARCARTNAVGWYGHLGNPQKNPLMSDLFIFNASMTRCLMVELKTHNVFQTGQKEMIERGAWELVTSYDDFVAKVAAFEKGE